MKIKGKIFESVTKPFFYNEQVFVLGYGSIWKVDSENLSCFYKQIEDFFASIALNGFWITQKNGETKFYDLLNLNQAYPNLKFKQSKHIDCIKDFLICVNFYENEVNIINIHSWQYKSLSYEGTAYLRCTEEGVYLRSSSTDNVICYDYDLNIVWEYQLQGDHYLDFELNPQLHKDHLIINHAYDTIALNKKTGEEAWKYTFDEIPTSNVLMDQKIYAVCRATLYVINPDTGEVEWTKKTGYEEYFPDNGNPTRDKNPVAIFPVGDYLYGVAGWADQGQVIRLFDKNLKLLYKTTFNNYYMNPYQSIQPIIHNGKIYQSVRNANSYSDSGVLVMELTEDESQAGIHIAPRPDVTMIAHPSLQQAHKLQIFLETTTLDDTLRYGELLTQELQFTTGYITSYNKRQNALDSQHNGIIELIIDDTGFEADSDEYLNHLAERLSVSLSGRQRKAGDKKTPISFKLIRQSKDQWDKSGEVLNWPAIREQKTPIS